MLLAVVFALALAAAPAHAIIRLPPTLARVSGNPAERLLSMPIEDSVYDPATHCSLARRMGVEELIWDCGYWGAGMTQFEDSMAHRNHIHIGLTRAGAARRTSFWSAAG